MSTKIAASAGKMTATSVVTAETTSSRTLTTGLAKPAVVAVINGPGGRLYGVNPTGGQQAADHGKDGAHLADDIAAGREEDRACSRPDDGLDDVVDRVNGGHFVGDRLDHKQHEEDGRAPTGFSRVFQGALRVMRSVKRARSPTINSGR